MDSGIGIGGLSTGKDETASSQFDLFESVELETGVKKIHTKHFVLYHQLIVRDPLSLKFLLIQKSLLMLNRSVCKVECELGRKLEVY